jgi:hypothetical protein
LVEGERVTCGVTHPAATWPRRDDPDDDEHGNAINRL